MSPFVHEDQDAEHEDKGPPIATEKFQGLEDQIMQKIADIHLEGAPPVWPFKLCGLLNFSVAFVFYRKPYVLFYRGQRLSGNSTGFAVQREDIVQG